MTKITGSAELSPRPDLCTNAAIALCDIAGQVARRLAVLAAESIPIADANITWVTKPD